MKVREKAVEWLANLSNDDICDFLPQLVQVTILLNSYNGDILYINFQ